MSGKLRRFLLKGPRHHSLTITEEGQGVATLPVLATRTTDGLVEAVSLAEATALATGRSQATVLAVLHGWLADPADAWVTTDGLVRRID